MNEREMKYWAIKKWRSYVKDDADMEFLSMNFQSDCSYCSVYLVEDCKGCPFNYCQVTKLTCGCLQPDHVFNEWNNAMSAENNEAIDIASKAVLNKIREIPVSRDELFFRGKNE